MAVGNRNLRPRSFFGLSCKSLVVCPEGKKESEEQQFGTDNDDDDGADDDDDEENSE